MLFIQFGNGTNIDGLNNVNALFTLFYDNLPPTEQFIDNFDRCGVFSLFTKR